ncbi:MAG: zinc metalloprotease HtpX [Deltaproteobacteria bacterium]|nr:MAG: zinc metalloprotease HtpX [Deltaproteobacteria bacterium]
MNNTIKTTILLAALTGLIVWIGQMLGGGQGAMIALVFAAVMNIGSYWFSDRIVIAMYRGQPIGQSDDPELYGIVHGLALKNHIPMPRLYLIPTDSPNAFATGRSPEHAAVAVTAGIRRLLDAQELEGVIAHELAHVTNRDILISSIAATLAGAIMMLANMARWSLIFGGMGSRDDREGGGSGLGLLFTLILAPIAAMLIQMAISRSREFQADETGARVSREPEALASALRKISAYSERIPLPANPATAHLFIVNPLHGVSLQNLFSTHPPLEQRIARLEQIASQLGQRR